MLHHLKFQYHEGLLLWNVTLPFYSLLDLTSKGQVSFFSALWPGANLVLLLMAL